MTLDFENERGEIRTFTTKSQRKAGRIELVETGDLVPYARTATNPEFVGDDTTPLNAYSGGFFVCWLIGLLVTAVVHFLHFS